MEIVKPKDGPPVRCARCGRDLTDDACLTDQITLQSVCLDGGPTPCVPIKIFVMNDCDWIAARSLEEAKTYYDQEIEADLDDPRELTEEELDRKVFVESDEDDRPNGEAMAFREKLRRMVVAGDKFPTFFASTEF